MPPETPDPHLDNNSVAAAAKSRSRLEPIRDRSFVPWRKSHAVTSCHLYWMPVAGPPIPFRQRQWCLRFAAKLRESLAAEIDTKANLFLQMKVIQPDLADSFMRHAPRFVPMLGLSRQRGTSLPAIPDADYIKRMQDGKIKYDHKAIQPDYCYWFLYPETQEQMDLYFGQGGLMTLFLSLPEAERPQKPFIPPGVANHPQFAALLADNRYEKMTDGLARMMSPFFPRSKAVFGRGLEDDLQYPGLKFIVPLLSSEDIHEAKPAEIEEWFTVFDAVFTESPKDKGLLLVSRLDLDLDQMLLEIMEAMRENEDPYPEIA